MRAQRLPLCFHIRNTSVNCCQPEAKRKERDADMVLLSVDVGYFQAGWQIKMMRALKKNPQCGSTFSRKLKYLVWRKNKNQIFYFCLFFPLFFSETSWYSCCKINCIFPGFLFSFIHDSSILTLEWTEIKALQIWHFIFHFTSLSYRL